MRTVLALGLIVLLPQMPALSISASLGATEPFEFVSSIDEGLLPIEIGRGWLGRLNLTDHFVATAHHVDAILEYELSSKSPKPVRKAALQNIWSAKEHPVRDALTTDLPIPSPYAMVIGPDDRHLYSNGSGTGQFPLLFIRDDDGKLLPVPLSEEHLSSGASLPPSVSLAISPDGLSVYGASWHTILVFRREPTSGKLALQQIIEDDSKGISQPGEEVIKYHKIPGATVVEKLRGVKDLQVSPDGKYLHAVCYGENAVTVFSREPRTGKLSFSQSLYDRKDADGKWINPRHYLLFAHRGAFSPDGHSFYVSTVANAVVVFVRDSASGKLTHVETIRNRDTAPEKDPNWIPALDYCVDICVSPDGKQVYVACKGKGAIVVFNRDGANQGRLKYLATLDAKTTPECRLKGVSHLCTTKDGKYLLALSSEALVNVFRRTELK